MSKPSPVLEEEESREDITTSAGKITAATTTTSTIKTVYLIRHAESEENRRLGALRQAWTSLRQFSLPARSDLRATAELVNIPSQIDSGLSPMGQEQIQSMAAILQQQNFVQATGIQLVVHSPLLRARETCFGMLQCRAAATTTTATNEDDNDTANSSRSNSVEKHDAVQRVEELDLLSEKTLTEWIPVHSLTEPFRNRIAAFEDWLHEQPETVVAVVGHSQYFRAMLGLPYKFGNCDVYEVQFDSAALSRREHSTTDTTTKGTTTTDPPQETTTSSGSDATTTTSTTSSFANWMPSIWKRGNDDAAPLASPPLESGQQQSASSSTITNSSTSNMDHGVVSSPPLPPQWSGLQLLYKCSIVSNKDDSDHDDAEEEL
jgi:glucosyl-3-phosphoglycerate phosphatase